MSVRTICQGKFSKVVVHKLNRCCRSPKRCCILLDAKPVPRPLPSLSYSYFVVEIFSRLKGPEHEGNHLSVPSAEIREHTVLSARFLPTCNT